MIDFISIHWEALFSLLLSVIAIAIAIFSSYQTSKSAKKQIESMQLLIDTSIKNADNQIEQIKLMTTNLANDWMRHLVSMKSLACALIENYLLNIEADIQMSEKEKEIVKIKLSGVLDDIREAEKNAKESCMEGMYPQEVDMLYKRKLGKIITE